MNSEKYQYTWHQQIILVMIGIWMQFILLFPCEWASDDDDDGDGGNGDDDMMMMMF